MKAFARICAAFVPLLLLSACLLTPGKFASTLDIRKDGTFTFTYKGEVIAKDFGQGLNGLGNGDGTGNGENSDEVKEDKAAYILTAAEDKYDKAVKLKAIADALAKERGVRSVRVAGKDRLEIDYAIAGRLDHGFIFPFNIDAEAVFPFVAVEVRKDARVRVQAPGFGGSNDKAGGMGVGDSTEGRDGTFTLTTDAEIVSHNREDGATTTAQGKRLVWIITPLTRLAPMAVLQLSAK